LHLACSHCLGNDVSSSRRSLLPAPRDGRGHRCQVRGPLPPVQLTSMRCGTGMHPCARARRFARGRVNPFCDWVTNRELLPSSLPLDSFSRVGAWLDMCIHEMISLCTPLWPFSLLACAGNPSLIKHLDQQNTVSLAPKQAPWGPETAPLVTSVERQQGRSNKLEFCDVGGSWGGRVLYIFWYGP
jgi:hypothetical protein